MKRRWFLAGGIAWLTALGAVLPALAAESTLDVVKKRGTLIAGVRYDTPPFGYVDKDGKVVGVDIEIVKYLANKLGVKLELIQVTAKTRDPHTDAAERQRGYPRGLPWPHVRAGSGH